MSNPLLSTDAEFLRCPHCSEPRCEVSGAEIRTRDGIAQWVQVSESEETVEIFSEIQHRKSVVPDASYVLSVAGSCHECGAVFYLHFACEIEGMRTRLEVIPDEPERSNVRTLRP